MLSQNNGIILSWLVVWNNFYFPIYSEFHHPNGLLFRRGVGQPPARLLLTIIKHIITIYKPLLTVY